MSRDSVILPMFSSDYRASGLLLHVTSLPSPYGIGDVGPAAVTWIDRRAEAGQSWWQAQTGRNFPTGRSADRRLGARRLA